MPKEKEPYYEFECPHCGEDIPEDIEYEAECPHCGKVCFHRPEEEWSE